MEAAMVSLSFPQGLTLPVSTSTAPFPPSIPPCHTKRTAEGAQSSTHFISIMFPTFQQDCRPCKMSADCPDHGFFLFRKQITARFRLCILILSRRTSDNHQRGITHLCRTCRCFIVQRHFLLGPGFLPPSLPFVKRMFQYHASYTPASSSFTRMDPSNTERIQNSGHITGIHQTARTGAAFYNM